MKTPMPQKPPETALWARRIFSARMSAKPAGRCFAKAKNRFAKGIRREAAGKLKPKAGNLKKLRVLALETALRFKRSRMPSSSSLKSAVCGLNKPAPTTPTIPAAAILIV